MDSYGRTALPYAAEQGHEAIVKLLLDMGKVDVDAGDTKKPTGTSVQQFKSSSFRHLKDSESRSPQKTPRSPFSSPGPRSRGAAVRPEVSRHRLRSPLADS